MDIASFLIGLQAGQNKAGGSGGGSLPAGVYLSSPYPSASGYPHKMFMLNGTLYATCANYNTGGYIMNISKWNGSAWETVLSSSSGGIAGNTMDSATWKGAELNGKLHMIDGTKHFVFDGATLVASTNAFNSENSVCVCQGKLYLYDDTYNAQSLYEWDDANSAWNTITPISVGAGEMLAFGDQLYFVKGSTVRKYVDGTLIEWGTAVVSYAKYVTVGDELYCSYSKSQYTTWYKVNLETMEYIEVGKHSQFYNIYPTVNADNLSFNGCTYSTNGKFPFFAVNIVEATE